MDTGLYLKGKRSAPSRSLMDGWMDGLISEALCLMRHKQYIRSYSVEWYLGYLDYVDFGLCNHSNRHFRHNEVFH